jgi:hypothetical protein
MPAHRREREDESDDGVRQVMKVDRNNFEDDIRAPNVLHMADVGELKADRPLEDLPWCLCGAGGPREEFALAEEKFTHPDLQHMQPAELWEEVVDDLQKSLSYTTDYIRLLETRIAQLENENARLRYVVTKRVLPYDIDKQKK